MDGFETGVTYVALVIEIRLVHLEMVTVGGFRLESLAAGVALEFLFVHVDGLC